MRSIVRHQGRVRLYEGDSREVLKGIPDNSLDSCSCDPPYALVSVIQRFGAEGAAPAKFGTDGLYARASAGFMGQKWDTGETAFAVEFWQEVLRVLKPGAHLVAFGGTRTYHHLAMAIELAGFEIRDQLAWTYGSGFPKSHSVGAAIDQHLGASRTEVTGGKRSGIARVSRDGGEMVGGVAHEEAKHIPTYAPATPEAAEWEGWGTSLKPAWEPIVLARKPLSERTVAANVLRWGTGALNVGGCRIGDEDRHNPSAKRNEIYGQFEGAETGGRSAVGRWPANILHDGSPEVLQQFPITAPSRPPVVENATSETTVNTFGKYNQRSATGHADAGGSAARFFYCAKASKADREEGCEHLPIPEGKTRHNIHPTVKPTPVMAWLTRLITPPGGVVLDPFMGSGSTGKACVGEGFSFIGIDAQPEFIPIAEARIAHAARKSLPAPAPEPVKELEYDGY